MSTTLPTDASKANSDASTDNPQQSILTDLAGVVDKFNELLDAFGAAAQLTLNSANFTTEDQGSGNPDTIIPKVQVVAKSAAYTLVASDRGKVYNLTGDAWTLGVTAAATLGTDWFCYVRNSGSGTITADPDGSETINDVTTLDILSGQGFILVGNGSLLFTIGLAGDGKAIVSSNDTTPGYLNGKLVAGTNITLQENNDGANETLEIISTGGITSVSQGDVDSATASQSVTLNSGNGYTAIISPTGGIWSFMGFIRCGTPDSGTEAQGIRYVARFASSNAAQMQLLQTTSTSTTPYLYTNYITASPPYDFGDGEIPYFIYALVENGTGKVLATYAAQDPPWAYNGKNRINPHKVIKAADGKQYILEKDLGARTWQSENAKSKVARNIFIENYHNAEETPIEFTMERKMAGCVAIPHPWVPELSNVSLVNTSVVMLDPMAPELIRMRELLLLDELDMSTLLHDGDIIINSTPVNRKVPIGVKAHNFSWR